jgi:hypothetical protein
MSRIIKIVKMCDSGIMPMTLSQSWASGGSVGVGKNLWNWLSKSATQKKSYKLTENPRFLRKRPPFQNPGDIKSLKTDFFQKNSEFAFPQKWLNQKTNGTTRKCSPRAFQWTAMSASVDFDKLKYFGQFPFPALGERSRHQFMKS